MACNESSGFWHRLNCKLNGIQDVGVQLCDSISNYTMWCYHSILSLLSNLAEGASVLSSRHIWYSHQLQHFNIWHSWFYSILKTSLYSLGYSCILICYFGRVENHLKELSEHLRTHHFAFILSWHMLELQEASLAVYSIAEWLRYHFQTILPIADIIIP